MKYTQRFLVIAIAAIFSTLTATARSFADESIDYRVMFKWGLVNKQAGHATLSLKNHGDNYNTMLTAASEKWADRYYKVRDTLIGIIHRDTFKPSIYEKRSHEGGEHKHDIVKYTYNGNTVTGTCSRKKWDKKGRLKTDEKRTLTAKGATIDMLSSFYYMRDLPYETYSQGHKVSVNLFSGKRKEILTIKYLGKQEIKIDKVKYDCYHISFTFTDPDNPKKKSSDDMDAWITTDTRRIPVKLEGKLPVGKVHCLYNPAK